MTDYISCIPKSILLYICQYCTFKTIIFKWLLLNKPIQYILRNEVQLWKQCGEKLDDFKQIQFLLLHTAAYVTGQQWRLKHCSTLHWNGNAQHQQRNHCHIELRFAAALGTLCQFTAHLQTVILNYPPSFSIDPLLMLDNLTRLQIMIDRDCVVSTNKVLVPGQYVFPLRLQVLQLSMDPWYFVGRHKCIWPVWLFYACPDLIELCYSTSEPEKAGLIGGLKKLQSLEFHSTVTASGVCQTNSTLQFIARQIQLCTLKLHLVGLETCFSTDSNMSLYSTLPMFKTALRCLQLRLDRERMYHTNMFPMHIFNRNLLQAVAQCTLLEDLEIIDKQKSFAPMQVEHLQELIPLSDTLQRLSMPHIPLSLDCFELVSTMFTRLSYINLRLQPLLSIIDIIRVCVRWHGGLQSCILTIPSIVNPCQWSTLQIIKQLQSFNPTKEGYSLMIESTSAQPLALILSWKETSIQQTNEQEWMNLIEKWIK